MAELRLRVAAARAAGDGEALDELLSEAARTAAMLQTLQAIHHDLGELQALLKAQERDLNCARAA